MLVKFELFLTSSKANGSDYLEQWNIFEGVLLG
jgi:hypothetical protein